MRTLEIQNEKNHPAYILTNLHIWAPIDRKFPPKKYGFFI